MKRLNRTKLIQLRNNIQGYLDKVEREDKVANLDKTILAGTTEVVNGFYDAISRKLDDVKTAPLMGTEEIVEAINGLKNGFSTTTPVDRTSEIVKAISDIRFPEVNFPNTISVDNFPPQRIPQPVTNIKATVVADDTGLLQDILNAITALDPTPGDLKQVFGSGNVTAGNTNVLATYTVPVAKILFVTGLYGEGIDNGLFSLYIDGVKQWQGRNAWTDRNVQSYIQYQVPTGKVVELKVTNIVNATRAYSGGFYGRQVDA